MKRHTLAVATAALALVASGGAAAAADAAKTGAERAPSFAQGVGGAGLLAAQEVGNGTVRLSGGDRYETAVDISRGSGWDEGTAFTVYLASGENFPDALAIGPSSFGDGPLLLTRRDALPQVTADELARLSPCMVVVVGGPAAVSDAVAAQADGFTEPGACEG